MNKHTVLILTGILMLSFSACKTVRKTQINSVPDNSGKEIIINESAKGEKELALTYFAKIKNNKTDFNTFASKLAVEFQSPRVSHNANANLRMEKNKMIWLSVTGPFGIEIFRAKITPDSVVLLDKLQSKVVRRDIDYLQNLVKVPVNFYDLQDLLLGNPVFMNGEPESYKNATDNIQFTLVHQAVKHLLTALKGSDDAVSVASSHIIDMANSRTADIVYDDYKNLSGNRFSFLRNIVVKENNATTTIHLEYKDPVFNQPVTFPFSIPKSYSAQ